ncbi:TetR family transcriptional regulator [Roseobacter cerasinus]|uniref:TetR family transcriptional regulator n=1 Tax=Roseobacter cerasinus TaxID=2602289 RepID=A0A640VTW0_9RHOB|nr:TetR/AcrR family transcriptional regulator [Roseobacter cerasinus]GFE51643.1 TetR family transcriptional regulator [Roseobacter cerasinus]
MPYSASHRDATRAKIVEAARVLFNRHGFQNVTIDQVMQAAGLTRGGFYNHFKSKEALFSEAVSSFLMGRGAEWRRDAGIDPSNLKPEMAQQMIDAYLSDKHLGDIEGQCPMIALPSDVARADLKTQDAFQQLLTAMVWLLETALPDSQTDRRQKALASAALCVGGMVLARTLPNSELAEQVKSAAHNAATQMVSAQNA